MSFNTYDEPRRSSSRLCRALPNVALGASVVAAVSTAIPIYYSGLCYHLIAWLLFGVVAFVISAFWHPESRNYLPNGMLAFMVVVVSVAQVYMLIAYVVTPYIMST